jgi:hypothetical protein
VIARIIPLAYGMASGIGDAVRMRANGLQRLANRLLHLASSSALSHGALSAVFLFSRALFRSSGRIIGATSEAGELLVGLQY